MSYYRRSYAPKTSTTYAPKASTSYAPKASTGSKPTYVYSLNCTDGKKYVGMTSNIDRRMGEHFGGRGAQWTQKNPPVSINHIQKCTSEKNAKKAEKIVYEKMRDYHGTDKVRGAGYTSSITEKYPTTEKYTITEKYSITKKYTKK